MTGATTGRARAAVTIATLELRRYLRDRTNLVFAFVFPLVLVVLLGLQFGGDGPSGRVALGGPDGALRDDLARTLRADDVDVTLVDTEDARELVARNRTDVAVLWSAAQDEEYVASAADPVAGRLELQVVAASQAGSQVSVLRVQTAVDVLSSRIARVDALRGAGVGTEAAADALAGAESRLRMPTLTVTDTDAVDQEFSGLGRFDLGASTQLLLFVFLSSLAGATTLIAGRRDGVVRRTLAAPVGTGTVIGGEALGRLVIALMQGVYIMGGTALLFGVDWGSWPLSLLVLLAFAAVSAAAAMVIGSVMDNERAAGGVGVGAGLILAALGGCMTPLEFFPDTFRTIAHVTPHAWGYDALADIQRHDAGLADLAPELGVLAAMAAALLALGSWLLRRSLGRAL